MNIDNINRVIAAVRAEPHHFVMKDWITNCAHPSDYTPENRLQLARNNPCNTAGCLGGWMDSLALCDIQDGKMQEPDPDENDVSLRPSKLAAAFVGVDAGDFQLERLFHMDHLYSLSRFDRLPDEDRAKAGARALEIFRDTGKSNWTQALQDTGVLEQVRFLPWD
jgi:hypothetical protein